MSGREKPLAVAAGAVVLAVAAVVGVACTQRRDEQPPEPDPVATPAPIPEPTPAGPKVALSSLDGLGLTKVGPPDDGPAGAEKWLRKVTVTVPVEGEPEVTGIVDASRWRGVALPRAENGFASTIMDPENREIRVRVAADGGLRMHRISVADVPALQSMVAELLTRLPELPVVFDANGAARMAHVLPVLAAMLEICDDVKFQAPRVEDGSSTADADLLALLKEETGRAKRDAQGLPNVCMRIRADAETPYRAVQNVMVTAMRAYVWRLSFVGIMDGKEVEIGPAYGAPNLPAEIVEHPVFIHEEVEVVDHMETEDDARKRAQEEAISAIPLGGMGIVGGIGIGGGGSGAFGFRTLGGRKRAVLRGGGSRASEAAVDAALRWLARNQEPEGNWAIRKWGGTYSEECSVGVTGLGLLAFLGAGHTEKTGKYKGTVRKAVNYLISHQQANGSIGRNTGSGGGGYNHAIAGLALAEAFGMAKVGSTGAAAQRAVDYSVNVHQTQYSGWRYRPRDGADMSVTVWFVMQLKSAKIAGLMVAGQGFQGAMAFLEKCTKEKDGLKGLVAYTPEGAPSPTMTAAGMVCRQLMGWTRTDPLLVGGANYLAQNLPGWGETERRFYYWYHGTLAMFQMGGDRWKRWNASLRDMLIEHQVNAPDDPGKDGSWDPVSGGAKAGRAYVTAMGALCLEVYYRYHPLYRE